MQINRYGIGKPEGEILAFPDHYVNTVGFIAYADFASLYQIGDYGEYVFKKGTVVHINGDGKVTKANGNGNGILFHTYRNLDNYNSDEQVTVTVLIHGFVRKDRLINADDLVANKQIFMVNQ